MGTTRTAAEPPPPQYLTISWLQISDSDSSYFMVGNLFLFLFLVFTYKEEAGNCKNYFFVEMSWRHFCHLYTCVFTFYKCSLHMRSTTRGFNIDLFCVFTHGNTVGLVLIGRSVKFPCEEKWSSISSMTSDRI